MEPAVVSVLIKSDRLLRRIPRTGETVRVKGRMGLFVVMRVDGARQIADLMRRTGRHELEENVPLADIHPVSRQVSQAIQEFLDS